MQKSKRASFFYYWTFLWKKVSCTLQVNKLLFFCEFLWYKIWRPFTFLVQLQQNIENLSPIFLAPPFYFHVKNNRRLRSCSISFSFYFCSNGSFKSNALIDLNSIQVILVTQDWNNNFESELNDYRSKFVDFFESRNNYSLCLNFLTAWIWIETNFNKPLWNSQRNNQWPILMVQSVKEIEIWVTNDKSLFDGSK